MVMFFYKKIMSSVLNFTEKYIKVFIMLMKMDIADMFLEKEIFNAWNTSPKIQYTYLMSKTGLVGKK